MSAEDITLILYIECNLTNARVGKSLLNVTGQYLLDICIPIQIILGGKAISTIGTIIGGKAILRGTGSPISLVHCSFSAAAVIQAPSAPLALRWLDVGATVPALLVACAAQGLLVYARQRSGAWLPVSITPQRDLAMVSSASPSGEGCLAIVAARRQITSLTDECR